MDVDVQMFVRNQLFVEGLLQTNGVSEFASNVERLKKEGILIDNNEGQIGEVPNHASNQCVVMLYSWHCLLETRGELEETTVLNAPSAGRPS